MHRLLESADGDLDEGQHLRLGEILEAGVPADLGHALGKEPPPWNRAYIQSRLAYRIQELAYGGLKPKTRARLEALGEQLDGGNVVLRRIRADSRPLAGTRLIREASRAQVS